MLLDSLNMRKHFIFILVIELGSLLFSAGLFAQDIIHKRDGAQIEALIDEISENVITYRRFDNPFGPKYKLSVDSVARVEFENGATEEFPEKVQEKKDKIKEGVIREKVIGEESERPVLYVIKGQYITPFVDSGIIGGKIGVYNIGHSPIGLSFGAYSGTGTAFRFGTDLSVLLRATKWLYPEIGLIYGRIRPRIGDSDVTQALMGNVGCNFLVGPHFILNAGAWLVPEIKAKSYLIYETQGVPYNYTQSSLVYSGIPWLYVGIGWAF